MKAAVCALNGRSGHDAGRELLQRLYFEETGQPLPEISITKRGKPYFPQSDLHFSISHTERHAFCVLAHCPVGLDAEEMDRMVRPALMQRALSPAEQLRCAQAEDPRLAFLALWVQKEAAVKLTGEGLRQMPNQTDFYPDAPCVREWEGCLVAILAENPDEGVSFHAF